VRHDLRHGLDALERKRGIERAHLFAQSPGETPGIARGADRHVRSPPGILDERDVHLGTRGLAQAVALHVAGDAYDLARNALGETEDEAPADWIFARKVATREGGRDDADPRRAGGVGIRERPAA